MSSSEGGVDDLEEGGLMFSNNVDVEEESLVSPAL